MIRLIHLLVGVAGNFLSKQCSIVERRDPEICERRTTDYPLHWRHNDHYGVSNHQPHGCLLSGLFRRRSNKTSKFRVTGLCVGNSPGPVNSPHKGPVTRKMFSFDDVIMLWTALWLALSSNAVSDEKWETDLFMTSYRGCIRLAFYPVHTWICQSVRQ